MEDRARVVSVGRNHVWLVFDDEETARSAELRKTREREMLVPGDRVRAVRRPDGSAFVVGREPRGRVLERRTPAGRTKIMAANIDLVLITAAYERPTFNAAMVDELLAFCVLHEIEAAMVFTKADLTTPEAARELREMYRALGLRVFGIDARHGEGLTELRMLLETRETLIIGSSGVGKSTLFAALGGEAVVGAVSERTGQGRQTTTSGRLHHFESGTLIDSPGIGEFSLDEVAPEVLLSLWPELAPLPAHCRFADCRHTSEPGCAVREAVESGGIAASRFSSYERARLRLTEAAKTRRR